MSDEKAAMMYLDIPLERVIAFYAVGVLSKDFRLIDTFVDQSKGKVIFILAKRRPKMSDVCTWTEDWRGTWNTGCKQAFEMSNPEGPSENQMRFCCFCGKPLEALRALKEATP